MGKHEIHIYGHRNSNTATSEEVPVFGVSAGVLAATDIWFGVDKEAEEKKIHQ